MEVSYPHMRAIQQPVPDRLKHHLFSTQILQASSLPCTCLQQADARQKGADGRTTILQVLANAVPPQGGINPAPPQGTHNSLI